MKSLADLERRRKSRLFVLVIGLLSTFAPLSIDMYLPSFPTLQRTLATDPAHVQLTLSLFVIGFGAMPLLVGPFLDRFGRRSVLAIATVLYIACSAACAWAASIDQLIALRFIQGVAAGCAPMAVRAMVRDTYEREDAARVMSLTMTIVGLAPILAPILGGQVLVSLGWRAIFLTLAGFGVLAGLLIAFILPETLPPQYRRQLDWRAAIGGYGQLLRHGHFMRHILTSAMLFGAMFAYVSGAPLVFIETFAVAPENFGFLFAITVVGMMGGASANSRLVRRLGSARLLRFGTALAACAGLAMLGANLIGGQISGQAGGWGLPGILAPMFFLSVAFGLVMPNASAIALQDWPHMAGSASALAGFCQFGFGAITGIVMGALHTGGALAMTAIMATCCCLCFAICWFRRATNAHP